jgi:hypothetical protein
MNCLPHFTIALRRWFTSAAYRPAGTREALPGTMLRNFRSAFSLEGTPESGPLRNSKRRTAKFERG